MAMRSNPRESREAVDLRHGVGVELVASGVMLLLAFCLVSAFLDEGVHVRTHL